MSLFERLAQHAECRPEGTALVWPGGRFGYAELVRQVEATLQLLRGLALEVIAVDLENGPAWVTFDLAAMQAGICLVPLPRFFSPGQLRHILRRSGAQAVLTDNSRRLRAGLGDLLADEEAPLCVGGEWVTWVATSDAVALQDRPTGTGVHKITFTSGTTGEPKGVMLSWAQMRPVVESLADAVGIGEDDRHLALMPLAVLLENIAGVYVSLWAGASVSLLPMAQVGMSGSSTLTGRTMALALAEDQATTAIFTPQTLQGLVEAMEAVAPPLGLRYAAVGGAPVSTRLLQRAAVLGIPVYEGYGLSECCSVVCLNTPAANRPGSVGRPLPHVQVQVSEEGEVMVEGQAFIGYLGEEVRDGSAWPTGDLGEFDADGFLHLRGRRRNVFITAFGRNVAPEWVERELTLEPAIAQAAVFGEARPYNVAVVVPATGAGAAEIETALARANRLLPDYARIAAWQMADSAFTPANGQLTGTGRIRREVVLDRYRGAIDSLYREVRTS